MLVSAACTGVVQVASSGATGGPAAGESPGDLAARDATRVLDDSTGPVATQSSAATLEPAETEPPSNVQLEQAAAIYRELRPLEGHFAGGEWSDDVDPWMSPKHEAMLELGSSLGQAGTERATIERLLGLPDRLALEGSELFDLISGMLCQESTADDRSGYMVYYWRDLHDFLFFVFRDGEITASGWWHAGE